jgi:hypothetical protein
MEEQAEEEMPLVQKDISEETKLDIGQ